MNLIIYKAILWLLQILELAILARVIISWLPISRDNQFIKLIYQITEPMLAPIRGIIERSPLGRNMMVDFSPLIALLIIMFIRNIL